MNNTFDFDTWVENQPMGSDFQMGPNGPEWITPVSIDGRLIPTDYLRIENLQQFRTTPPLINPEDPSYDDYWSLQTKRCIEGLWGRMFGKWRYMRGNLYFYMNFTVLEQTDRGKRTQLLNPVISDLEWELSYGIMVARGFSGFSLDDEYTSLKKAKELIERDGYERAAAYLRHSDPEAIDSNGRVKKYMDPLENCRRLHDTPVGIALFLNQTQNFMPFGSRGGGKSYYIGLGEIEHGLLFDGSTIYDDLFRENKLTAVFCVGSGDSEKSSEFCQKLQSSIDVLTHPDDGKQFGVWGRPSKDKSKKSDFTPCPFYRHFSGTLDVSNKENPFIYTYEIIENGAPIEKGTQTRLFHVNYSTGKARGRGAQAGSGGRYLLSVVEEAGLCFGKGVKVRMANHSLKNVEDVKVGDLVMGRTGQPRLVKAVTTGNDDLYRVVQKFGNDYVVNSKHLLVLKERYKKQNVEHFVNSPEFLSWGKCRQQESYGVKTEGLEFGAKSLGLDPYYMGLWVGDGIVRDSSIIVAKQDFEIELFLQNYAESLGRKLVGYRSTSTKKTKVLNIVGVGSKRTANPIRKYLKEQGLLGLKKEIPQEYFNGSRDQRLQLLAGLIDSDGNVSNAGTSRQCYKIGVSKNEILVEQISWLATSLGLKVRVSKKLSDKGFGKTIVKPRLKYVIRISGKVWDIPCKVERKKLQPISHVKDHLLTSIKVESIGRGEYFGFTLDEDPLFLLEDGTVVHNCENLIDVHTSNESTVAREGVRFGTEIYIGTSGNMKTVHAARKMFLNPEDYNILSYPNKFGSEGRNGRIGFFIPFYMTLRRCKDKDGNTNFFEAARQVEDVRAEKQLSSDPQPLLDEKMNRPCFVEEMWLTPGGSIMPVAELEKVEQDLLIGNKFATIGTPVKLVWDSSVINGVRYEVDHDAEPYTEWPLDFSKRKMPTGCPMIYHPPIVINGQVPDDLYTLVGHDPYVEENIAKGGSVGTTYIMANSKYIPFGHPGNIIVASYIDKPLNGLDQYYETQEKLLALYGNPKQSLWFESNRGADCRAHYIKKGKTNLLAPTPQLVQGTNIFQKNITNYGYFTGSQLFQKAQMAKWIRDFLLQRTTFQDPTGFGQDEAKMNLERLPCIFLVRQLINYNLDDNFDAVDGFRGCVVGLMNTEIQNSADHARSSHVDELMRAYYDNPKIFNNGKAENRKYHQVRTNNGGFFTA